jgi:hypothetical protein
MVQGYQEMIQTMHLIQMHYRMPLRHLVLYSFVVEAHEQQSCYFCYKCIHRMTLWSFELSSQMCLLILVRLVSLFVN